MGKTFLGIRVKSLREQQGLTQAALAQALKLSPSYVNQIESNQRPLTVTVLLRLQALFGIDLRGFSDDEQSRAISDLREVTSGIAGNEAVPLAELRAVAEQMPAIARALLTLHRRCHSAEERLAALAASTDGDRSAGDQGSPLQPHEEVREFFYSRHQQLSVLDERAEALHERMRAQASAEQAHDLATMLEWHLGCEHGVRLLHRPPAANAGQVTRIFDPVARTLWIAPGLEPGQRAFQMAIQIALLTVGPLIDSFVEAQAFASSEAGALARIGFANHFAGALLLPYRRFLADAEALRYDIDLLSARHDVSFETICHRLSTMQRSDTRGIPFFFVRVDRAGNVSKRQSTTEFHFSRTGGTCPLWNVYEAFVQPGKVLTQLSRMPGGGTFLWIARTVTHQRGGYGELPRSFAVALGCDIRHADRLVYSKGLDLNDPRAATPIGAGCKVCDREDCAQRAFPALGKSLRIDENVRKFAPYSSGFVEERQSGP